MFISKKDLLQAVEQALQCDSDYLAAFAISNNDSKLFDLKETNEKLGFYPQDNAEDYFN